MSAPGHRLHGTPVLRKDEGMRFGIGSFKALGGVHAVIEAVRARHGATDGARPSIETLFEETRRARNANAVHVCASVGNHGIREAFEASGEWPSDVYLHAGVGGLAGAPTWDIRHRRAVQPRIVTVEPDAAPCLTRSAGTGTVATVDGPASSMGRLDCKTASPPAVDALRGADVEYLALSDAVAERAVEVLAGLGIGSTPSGAAGVAAWCVERGRATCAGALPPAIVSEAGPESGTSRGRRHPTPDPSGTRRKGRRAEQDSRRLGRQRHDGPCRA